MVPRPRNKPILGAGPGDRRRLSGGRAKDGVVVHEVAKVAEEIEERCDLREVPASPPETGDQRVIDRLGLRCCAVGGNGVECGQDPSDAVLEDGVGADHYVECDQRRHVIELVANLFIAWAWMYAVVPPRLLAQDLVQVDGGQIRGAHDRLEMASRGPPRIV